MYCVQEVAPQIFWVGGNDRRLERFENMFPLPNGVAYNSYLIMDEKTALMDTVDSAISALYLENVVHVLQGRKLDYLIVNHMEPDHCANIEELLRRYPEMKIVGNKTTFQFIEQFYTFTKKENYFEVKEGDQLSLGEHTSSLSAPQWYIGRKSCLLMRRRRGSCSLQMRLAPSVRTAVGYSMIRRILHLYT